MYDLRDRKMQKPQPQRLNEHVELTPPTHVQSTVDYLYAKMKARIRRKTKQAGKHKAAKQHPHACGCP